MSTRWRNVRGDFVIVGAYETRPRQYCLAQPCVLNDGGGRLLLSEKCWDFHCECFDPSTLGSADGPVVSDGDDPATPTVPCDAVGPAPVIPVPVIPAGADP